MALLDEDGRKRLEDQSKTNGQRFAEYDADLQISFHSTPRQLAYHRWLIAQFKAYLGEFPPTFALASQFMASDRFKKLKPRSLDRYYRIVKRFLDRQCGIPFKLEIQKTRSLPKQIETGDINKLCATIAGKQTHKKTILRDLLLIEFDKLYGLRAAELADIIVRDIQFENRNISVEGKGNKDRNLPMTDDMLDKLKTLVIGKAPNDSLFGLKDRTISNKVGLWGRKSGTTLHAHALRHYAAEQLLNAGAGLEVVQDFLGHESPETTRAYIAANPERLRTAIERVGKGETETPEAANTAKITDLLAKVDKLVDGTGTIHKPDEGDLVRPVSAGSREQEIADTLKALKEFTVRIGEVDLDAASVLNRSWDKFSNGIVLGEFLGILVSEFQLEGVNFNLVCSPGESLIAHLNLHQIIRQEPRLRGVKQKEVIYWVLTDFGKKVVLAFSLLGNKP